MKFTGLFLLFLSLTYTLQAQVPGTINFQGNLTDPETGNPIEDGDYNIDFILFDAETEGSSLWAESHAIITVINGIFNVKLGSLEPFDPVIFAAPVWLEITVASEKLAPRIAFSSTSSSFVSQSLVGEVNMVPSSGNTYLGGNVDVGGVFPIIDLAIDDDDTGLEVPADGTLSFYTDGEERMLLDNSGTLFIGAPISSGTSTVLELNYDGKGNGFGGMWITNSATSGQPYYGYQNGNGAAYHYIDGGDANKWKLYNSGIRLTVGSDGNVGIGTTSPSERLSVNGNITTSDTVKADVYYYNTPKVSYYSIPPSQFKIAVGGYDDTYYLTSSYYGTYVSGGVVGSNAYLIAPINLPHNARITNAEFFYFDTDATYDISAYLYGVPHGTSSIALSPVIAASSGTPGNTSDGVTLNHVVDNSANHYWIYIVTKQATSSLQVKSVVLTYEIDTY